MLYRGRISWTIPWHTAGFHWSVGRIFYQNVKKILPPLLLGRNFAFLYTIFSPRSSKGGVPNSIDLSRVEHYRSPTEKYFFGRISSIMCTYVIKRPTGYYLGLVSRSPTYSMYKLRASDKCRQVDILCYRN